MDIAIQILTVVYLIVLGFWGYEDKENIDNPDGQVSGRLVVALTLVYLAFYCIIFVLSPYSLVVFLGFGLLLSLGIWIVLRKQMAALDHFAILLGNIAFPYYTIPALIVMFALAKILLHYRRQEGHAYLFVYFVAFLVVFILEKVI